MSLQSLAQKYAEKELDLFAAAQVWKEEKLSPEKIRSQVSYDTGERITSAEAKELYRLGEEKQSAEKSLKDYGVIEDEKQLSPFYGINYNNQNKDYGGMEAVAKEYKVSKGREELLPYMIKNRDKIKFTPTVRMAMDKVGKNLYRDKIASKYWTLKEKVGEDGKKSIFLVAVETEDKKEKE